MATESAPPTETKGWRQEVHDDKDRVMIFDNPDKKGHKPTSGAAEWLPAFPARMLFTGPPGSGKRNNLLNVLMRMQPPPDRIMVLHLDPESKEYRILEKLVGKDNVAYYTPDDPPKFEEIEGGDVRTVLVVDETPTKSLPKKDQSDIERLCNYGSTHKNCTILFCFQELTNISPPIRKAFNHFVLQKGPDDAFIKLAAHRTGVPPEELHELMTLCKKKTDSIWIDASVDPNSKWRYRLNLSRPIYMAT